MLGEKYIVKEGDTLWDIASKELSNPMLWQLIYEHNCLPEVVKQTGTTISDPDLILIGQTLYIPKQKVPDFIIKPVNKTNGQGKSPAKKLRGIPFKYSLNDLPSSSIIAPGYIAEIKLAGDVTIQSSDAVDFLTAGNENFVITAKKNADMALNQLVIHNQISWDPRNNGISFENGITINSDFHFMPSFKIAAAASTSTGLPTIKAEGIFPPIRGKVNEHLYLTSNFSVIIEITPRPPDLIRAPRPVEVPVHRTIPRRQNESTKYFVAAGLLLGATALVIATIVEDIVTSGVGVWNDAASFATASAMLTAVGPVLAGSKVSGQQPIQMESSGF